jgi:hypothetical protein
MCCVVDPTSRLVENCVELRVRRSGPRFSRRVSPQLNAEMQPDFFEVYEHLHVVAWYLWQAPVVEAFQTG